MTIRPITFLLPAAIALALAGPLHAAGDVPGFNEMDKNSDGQLTRSEAQGSPKLADQFAQVDDDSDGSLSRAEYLAIMGRQDLFNLRENLAEFLEPEGKAPLAAGQEAPDESVVRNVQQALRDKGIDAGPVDGIWGPQTSSGVRQFQKDQGLDTSGQLNSQTLGALGIAGEGSASAGESAKPAAKSGSGSQPRP
jgi:hypothetical protein